MTGLLTGCDGGVVYNDVAFQLLPVINFNEFDESALAGMYRWYI